MIYDLESLKKLADDLAANAEPGNCYCLIGDLGAGKTEFSRAFIRAYIGREITVGSPTFNILQIYESSKAPIYHFDLYRIKDESELLEIGFDEALNRGIVLVEWPQIARNWLPQKHVEIYFQIIDEKTRNIEIKE